MSEVIKKKNQLKQEKLSAIKKQPNLVAQPR
jgi:hypothetical protein